MGWAQSASNEEILCTSIDDLLEKVNSSSSGLTPEQAEESLEIYGYNEVARRKHARTLENIFR